MIEFIQSNGVATAWLLALAAGAWRVVDGRGKEWFPLPTWARNLGTLLIASSISVLVLGATWGAAWASICASIALIRGFPDGTWESLSGNAFHWCFPATILVIPLVFFGITSFGYAALYIFFGLVTGCIYYAISSRKIGHPIAYATEFSAGFTATGMIMVL